MFAKSRRHGLLWPGCVLLMAGGLILPAEGGSGGWVEFENQTSTRLVAAPGLGSEDPEEKDYAYGDVDQDGDLDLVCVRKQPWTTPGRRRAVLFMNEGIADGQAINGVLVDRTVQYATDADDGGQGFLDATNNRDIALVDVTGDGWLDMVTAVTISEGLPKTISHPRVYINKGAPEGTWLGFRYEVARFPQLTTASNPLVAPRFCSVAFGDIDMDGDNDLYFGDYDSAGAGGSLPEAPGDDVNDRLLINDGNGFFTDSGTTRMSPNMLLSAFSMAAQIVDMNGDGFPDVVKDSGLNAPQRVSISYNNPQNPGFFNAFDVVYESAPYHVVVSDLNNDDRPDMVITDDGADRYLLNTGNGADGLANFTPRSFAFQGGGGDDGFGGNNYIFDLNNDGFKDVVIADVDVDIPACNRRLHIYRNLGDTPNVTLQEQGGAAPWTPQGTFDLAIFDVNGDNWLDMVIGTCEGTEVWINQPPIGLVFGYPQGLPGLVPPNEGLTFRVQLTSSGMGQPVPGSAVLHLFENGTWEEYSLTEVGPNEYEATFPPRDCAETYRWYVSGMVDGGFEFTDPSVGAADPFVATAANDIEITMRDEIEGDVTAWTVVNQGLQAGAWEAVDPIGTLFVGQLAAPNDDASAAAEAVKAFVTMNGNPGGTPSASDVDGGPTYLISPRVDLAGTDGTISYSQWYFCHNAGTPDGDEMTVEVSNNDGQTWTHVRDVTSTGGNWEVASFQVGDYVEPTGLIRVRFGVSDTPNNSLTEAGIDNFQVQALVCGGEPPLVIVSSDPPSGAIDAGQPTDPSGNNPSGWNSVVLTFSSDASALTINDFTISVEPAGQAPPLTVVSGSGNTAHLSFYEVPGQSIPTGRWTTITHNASGSSVRLGYLPGDVNGDATSSPVDILAIIDNLNGLTTLPSYSTDVDRSGVTNPADILRVIDLLNGAGAYDVWNGVTLP